ncbi:MAG: pyrimidine dimer DNA glycosylase/endonuclease V [Porticoccaceae bacterium]
MHPRYLDAKGLVALWREALLAQKVLRGETRGYRNHPQLHRFKTAQDPLAAIATYLRAVREEAARRGYRFDASKIGASTDSKPLMVTAGQVSYELKHLQTKLAARDPARLAALDGDLAGEESPQIHPLFRVTPGPVEDWEIL